jgi:sugar phosphate isomerase/epimerase
MRLGLEAGSHTHELAHELGIQGVPIDIASLVNQGPQAILDELSGLTVCQIGAFGFNPLSPDRDAQAEQQRLLEAAIPLAPSTGCPYIVICGGNYHPSGFGAHHPDNATDAALDRVAEVLAPLLKTAERHGVKLCIEAYLKTAISSPERFLALKARLPSDALRVNIDVTSYYDYQDFIDPSATIHHVCTALAGHYGLVHIKDVVLREGFHLHAELAPLGASPTDWAEVLRLCAPHTPDDSWLILEHVQTPDEARLSVARLHEAAIRAGVTLR